MSAAAARREEEKARRREQILDAAVSVAAEHGMAEFSMDQLARKARLSRALLYVYFHDKQDLLLGLAERAQQMLYERFEDICARKLSGLKKLQSMGRSYVEFAHEFPVYFEALCTFAAHEAGTDEQRSNALRCLQSGDRITQQLECTIKEGIADGSLRKSMGAPTLVALTLWSFMHGIVQTVSTKRAVLEFKDVKPEQLINQALALCTRALQKE